MTKPKQEAIEGELVETQWDIKRIIIGAVIIITLLILASYLFPSGVKDAPDTQTLGVISSDTNEKKPAPLPKKEDIEAIIRGAQETLSTITSDNLTSSQAAIQRMISDLELLQGNKDVKDVICDLVCKK